MKYMGSKQRLAKHILPIILADRKEGQYYVEPFCGGCNLIDKVSGNRIANDINHYLIATWKALQEGWLPETINKEAYQAIKANRESYPPELVGWVGVNCSYSGKWFGGFAGKVVTKQGIRDYQEEAFKNTLAQAELLKGVIFSAVPYYDLKVPESSIVYCDPPYEGTTGYNSEIDHIHFWDWVRELSSQGHSVFVSEYKAPSDFTCVWSGKVSSSLSANGLSGANKISTEKLFTIV